MQKQIDLSKLERPTQSWEQFVRSMPPGKSPQMVDIRKRWNEFERITAKNGEGKEVTREMRSLENGEERMYAAWVTGVMEPDESEYLSMLTLGYDALLRFGIVPAIRERIKRASEMAVVVGSLLDRVKKLEEEITALQPRNAESKNGGAQ